MSTRWAYRDKTYSYRSETADLDLRHAWSRCLVPLGSHGDRWTPIRWTSVQTPELLGLVAALTVHHLRIAGKLDTVPQGTQLEIPDEAYEPVGA